MDELRWILLLIGLVLVAGIYFFGRRRNARDESLLDAAHDIQVSDGARRVRRPVEDDPEEFDGIADQLEQLNHLLADRPGSQGHDGQKRAPGEQASSMQQPFEKIIAIHVAAPRGSTFSGADLLQVFEERGYRFGEHDIFHSIHEDCTVFSIVNMVKPGWFDPQAMEEFDTPGISLFLQLPGPLAAIVAFDILVAEADALARALGGSLQDASHSTLTQQTIQHLREEVQTFARQRAAAGHHDH